SGASCEGRGDDVAARRAGPGAPPGRGQRLAACQFGRPRAGRVTVPGQRKNKDEKVRRSYAFLLKHEKDGSAFTMSELVAATGWKPGTAKTYPNKKWAGIVTKDGATYRVHGVSKYSEAEYV